MPNSAKRRLAAGAVGLAVLAGTGGAYAAAQSSTPTPSTAPSKPKFDPAVEQKASASGQDDNGTVHRPDGIQEICSRHFVELPFMDQGGGSSARGQREDQAGYPTVFRN